MQVRWPMWCTQRMAQHAQHLHSKHHHSLQPTHRATSSHSTTTHSTLARRFTPITTRQHCCTAAPSQRDKPTLKRPDALTRFTHVLMRARVPQQQPPPRHDHNATKQNCQCSISMAHECTRRMAQDAQHLHSKHQHSLPTNAQCHITQHNNTHHTS